MFLDLSLPQICALRSADRHVVEANVIAMRVCVCMSELRRRDRRASARHKRRAAPEQK
jgi:hypothetical protein